MTSTQRPEAERPEAERPEAESPDAWERTLAEVPVIPVSLILTTRNEAANVETFLDGVRAQTVRPVEIIVCDGGSTDGTADLLRRRGRDLPLRVLELPGANIARGRNEAIRAATQDVLAITDAGCVLAADWLERITAPLLDAPLLDSPAVDAPAVDAPAVDAPAVDAPAVDAPAVDAVGGGYVLTGENRVQRWTRAATLPVETQDPRGFLPSSRSFAARRAALERAGLYPEQLSFAGEDTALVLKMKAQGARFVTCWEARVQWDVRPTFGAFLRQHYLYGRGDGEAGSNTARYRRTAIKWAGIAVLPLLGVLTPWLLLVFPFALWLNARRLCPLYGWRARPLSERLGAYLFVAVKEWSLFAGYVVGRLRGIPSRGDA